MMDSSARQAEARNLQQLQSHEVQIRNWKTAADTRGIKWQCSAPGCTAPAQPLSTAATSIQARQSCTHNNNQTTMNKLVHHGTFWIPYLRAEGHVSTYYNEVSPETFTWLVDQNAHTYRPALLPAREIMRRAGVHHAGCKWFCGACKKLYTLDVVRNKHEHQPVWAGGNASGYFDCPGRPGHQHFYWDIVGQAFREWHE